MHKTAAQLACYEMQTSASRERNHLAVAQVLQGILDKSTGTRTGVCRAAHLTEQSRLLPKIARHLALGKKRLNALETYFRAGKQLTRDGSSAAFEMFRQCNALADELGDDVSIYMRASRFDHEARLKRKATHNSRTPSTHTPLPPPLDSTRKRTSALALHLLPPLLPLFPLPSPPLHLSVSHTFFHSRSSPRALSTGTSSRPCTTTRASSLTA